jgi:hypothetical protein
MTEPGSKHRLPISGKGSLLLPELRDFGGRQPFGNN